MPPHIHQLWKNRLAAAPFRSGVSLHSHTLHSRENMAFLPRHAYRIPIVADIIRRHERTFLRKTGRELDYNRAWWTPPLPASDAFRLEAKQIQDLGLEPIVSLTDHDSIDAGRELQLLSIDAPVSVEWTVPYAHSFLHIGVHNLPPADASDWMRLFAFWTARPRIDILRDIFAGLHAMPGVLTVVNHPLWDEGGIGPAAQLVMVREFIHRFAPFLHALELNGLRPWAENRRIVQMAAAFGLPALSGGDRHGCEPNANINLTNAGSFAEFAQEVRVDKTSEVLFLPQYREPHNVRCAETMWDALRDYPEYPGRELWSDRIFFQNDDGRACSLTTMWQGAGPGIVRNFIGAMRIFQHQSVRNALRFAFAERQENPAG
ncbi:MAG: PHP domain-containing protein [Bryobacteraceae bacterium]